jgi:pilus assembly protein Flp/PilA
MSLNMKRRSRRGQGLVEYIIIVAAVALISLVAVSVFGHKVADQYAIGAGMLPGAHAEDNLAIVTGEYAGFAENAAGDALIATGGVTWADITGNTTSGEMDNNPVTNADATTGLPDNSADSFVGE